MTEPSADAINLAGRIRKRFAAGLQGASFNLNQMEAAAEIDALTEQRVAAAVEEKWRLSEIRYANESAPTGPPGHSEIVFLLRLLYEAIAERDAATNELSLWRADQVMLDLQTERDRYKRELDAAMTALQKIAQIVREELER